ncbi:thioredoxin family protein [Flavobacterium agrisoli]|uniref:Thioredoxin family protein n=1 Tax=Flavobacterium agrisoli TaxID=2793066 RepID=A0A934PQB7_9FLAO|nr:thioredoxin family protein [Flavobacterium agrisoli]MBK0370678.1 thioredoxin family protein [Flavobacterium agrisoli]
MKKYVMLFLFFIGCFAMQAQELNWHTDVKEAVDLSAKEHKPIMLFFTGSDWCGWCIRLQNEVLKTPEFAKWAQENVILVELDFPRRTAQSPEIRNQNNQLQQVFGIQGFPTVFFANVETTDGKINFKGLGRTGYVAGGPQPWLDSANTILKNK